MKRTPGPWARGDARDCAKTYAICAGPLVVARVSGLGYPIGMGRAPESDGNAALIAAAPDLLAALRALLDASALNEDAIEPSDVELIEQAREAIAKAEA